MKLTQTVDQTYAEVVYVGHSVGGVTLSLLRNEHVYAALRLTPVEAFTLASDLIQAAKDAKGEKSL